MNLFRLPVSGVGVLIRQPAGADDLLLLEAPVCDAALALAFVGRIAEPAGGASLRWEDLPVGDLDAVLLRIRQLVFGDLIRTDVTCPVERCGKRIDVAFRVGDYLAHHAPRPSRGAEPADEPGWFRLQGAAVSFRLPTLADQLAVASDSFPERELIGRCVKPPDASASLIRRIEHAMESLAPSLAHNLQARCPECGVTVMVYFDPQQFTLRELRDQAVFIYEDTHLLAQHYHWPEAEILALPRERRIRYAEMVRSARSAA